MQLQYNSYRKCLFHSFPNRTNTNEDQHTYTQTLRRFDNPLCDKQQQLACATPPQSKPKPTQRQREEPVYAISLATNRRDNRQPTNNIQNGPNQALSGEHVLLKKVFQSFILRFIA